MADIVLPVIIEKLADLLIHETGLVCGVRSEIERLQTELKRMHCFLKDADAKHEQDARVANWIHEIRVLAYQTEDVIDDFVLKSHAYGSEIGIRRLILKMSWLFTRGLSLYKIGSEIRSIRTALGDIYAATQTYGIKLPGYEELQSNIKKKQQLRRTYAHYEEDHLIIDQGNSLSKVVNELMKEESQLCVVSIVGMGGLGKTTLARKVYNHADVKRRFDCCSWGCISQQFSMKDFLPGILKQVTHGEFGAMNEDELVYTLHDVLKEKRYLVVLDDIWEVNSWKLLKPAFPNGRSGSKILFTTRMKDVATYAGSSPIELPFLTEEEGWELLKARAFPRQLVVDHGSLEKFKRIGKEIVSKCGGPPLAIVVLGGLLATKGSLHEWEAVGKNISKQLSKLEEQHYTEVRSILALSYQELPFHLKPCFLYLSQFPEDFEIRKRSLIQMWIAEGFIPHQENPKDEETMEDVGAQYLEELINRCMVQVSSRGYTGIGVKTCRLHDLMRDFCVSEAAKEKFLVVKHYNTDSTLSHISATQLNTAVKPRRMAIHKLSYEGSNSSIPLLEGNLYLRSLLYFGDDSIGSREATFVYKKCRLLKILDFGEQTSMPGMAKDIDYLHHLRYLRADFSGELSTSIGNLRNLLTLNLGFKVGFPDVLWKLERLRYFRGFIRKDYRVDTLKQLVYLNVVYAKNLIKNDAMFKLTNLRNLRILFETKEEFEVIMRSPIFSSDGFLRSLNMTIAIVEEYGVSLEQLSHCHHLVKLKLEGAILEDEIHFHSHSLEFLPKSICELTLTGSELKLQDPMGILEKLPELKYLHLFEAYSGCKMVCSAYGFPKLEILDLTGLYQLEEWIVEENAMPCLNTLVMLDLDKLKGIPYGFKFLKNLQTLFLAGLNKEVVDKIRVVDGIEGDEFNVVRHIPTIHIYQ